MLAYCLFLHISVVRVALRRQRRLLDRKVRSLRGSTRKVGAGGIGLELIASLRLMQYNDCFAILITILCMVTLVGSCFDQ